MKYGKTNSLNLYYGWRDFLLIMVLWKGKVVNNAQSWIFGIQPAEFLKLGTILVTARFFALRQNKLKITGEVSENFYSF